MGYYDWIFLRFSSGIKQLPGWNKQLSQWVHNLSGFNSHIMTQTKFPYHRLISRWGYTKQQQSVTRTSKDLKSRRQSFTATSLQLKFIVHTLYNLITRLVPRNGWLVGWLVGWLLGCLVGWLVGLLVGLLVGCLLACLVGLFFSLLVC